MQKERHNNLAICFGPCSSGVRTGCSSHPSSRTTISISTPCPSPSSPPLPPGPLGRRGERQTDLAPTVGGRPRFSGAAESSAVGFDCMKHVTKSRKVPSGGSFAFFYHKSSSSGALRIPNDTCAGQGLHLNVVLYVGIHQRMDRVLGFIKHQKLDEQHDMSQQERWRTGRRPNRRVLAPKAGSRYGEDGEDFSRRDLRCSCHAEDEENQIRWEGRQVLRAGSCFLFF